MRTKSKILITVAGGALTLAVFAASAAADDDARDPRNEMHAQMGDGMHAQMGGVTGEEMMSGDGWEAMHAMHDLFPAMTEGGVFDHAAYHASHHPAGS